MVGMLAGTESELIIKSYIESTDKWISQKKISFWLGVTHVFENVCLIGV